MEQNGYKNSTEDGLNCKHPEVEYGYGFGRSSGWKGIGGYKFCTSCWTTLEFFDDIECMTPEEIEHNRRKREALLALQEMC